VKRSLLSAVLFVTQFATPFLGGGLGLASESTTGGDTDASIQGRVSNAQTGEAVPHATVKLTALVAGKDGNIAEFSTTSQTDGGFKFDSVPAGTYFLRCEATGYVKARRSGTQRTIDIHPGQPVRDVAIQLNPEASLSVKVLDDSGVGVSDVDVKGLLEAQVSGRKQLRQMSQARTNQAGECTLRGLSTGSYIFTAEPVEPDSKLDSVAQTKAPATAGQPGGTRGTASKEPAPNDVQTYYPSGLTLDEAEAVEVNAGQELGGITIRLRRTLLHSVRGKVDGLSIVGGVGQPMLQLFPQSTANIDASSLARPVGVASNGSFKVESVTPGSYTLELTARVDTAPGPASTGGSATRLLARADITVGASDIRDLVLSAAAPITIAGHVEFDGGLAPDVSVTRIMLLPLEPVVLSTRPKYTTVKPDGSFVFENLDPSKYLIRASAPPGTYVQSIRYNQQTVTVQPIDLTSGSGGELHVILRNGAAQVEGTVQSASAETETGSAPATGIVLVLPDSFAADGWGAQTAPVRDGKFSIDSAQPGHYTAFAIQRYDRDLWRNTDFLREVSTQGISLEVGENTQEHIALTEITEEQVNQAAVRAGIFSF
jgi:Carboxypeptidase regulatory-like domain